MGSNSQEKHTNMGTAKAVAKMIETEIGGNCWQDLITNLSDSISYLFNNELMSDVHFQVEHQGKIETFHAHKFVLSIRSSVFDAMFNGALKKTENPEIVKIEDIEPDNFSEFLRFLYTDQYVPSAENVAGACGVLYAALKYNIPKLIKLCQDFIKVNLRPAEIFTIKRMCTLIYPELFNYCCAVMDKEAGKIVQSEEFLSIDNNELCEYVKRDGLSVPELDLFNAVIKWANERCKSDNIPGTPQNLRDVLGEALFLVRFPTMSLSEFSVHVVNLKLLTTEEAHDVFHYLALKSTTTASSFSLELPKTAFNCSKRVGVVFRQCRKCRHDLLPNQSTCGYCGKHN